MKLREFVFFLLALIVSGCSQEQNTHRTANLDEVRHIPLTGKQLLQKAKIVKGTSLLPEKFGVKTDTTFFIVSMDGEIMSGDNKATLPMGKGFYLVNLHYYDLDSNLVLVADMEDGETGHVEVFTVHKDNLELRWKNNLSGFGTSAGAVKNNILYTGIRDVVYALDCKNGKILWQASNLYSRFGIPRYDSLTLLRDEVLLFGRPDKQNAKNLPDSIRINRLTGDVKS